MNDAYSFVSSIYTIIALFLISINKKYIKGIMFKYNILSKDNFKPNVRRTHKIEFYITIFYDAPHS